MIIRGKAFSFGHRKIAKNVFVGKNVKVIEKKASNNWTKDKIARWSLY